MKKFISMLWDAIIAPFVLLDETRRENLDGSWDSYWAKKNCKAELRELKANYKRQRAEIKEKWGN